jgi:uncharacterized damage-inducible protein DinB
MSESQHLAAGIQGFLTDAENGWFDCLPYTAAGLTSAQAAQTPAKGFNSVWQVVEHMRYWEEYCLQHLQGATKPDLGADWPPITKPGEAAWKACLDRLYETTGRLCAYVAGLTDAQLDEPFAPGKPPRRQMLQGVLAHNSYHTCEVITIRHMLGLWLERT